MSLSSRFTLCLSAFALFAIPTAFAAPKVGDTATLEGTLVGDGMNARVSTVQKVIASDVNTGVYTVQQVQTIGSQSTTKEIQVSAGDMITEEIAAKVVELCESQGIGQKERVTVGAGTFNTCRAVGNGGDTIWAAAVPFGYVKLQTKTPAGTVNISLTSFSRGK